MRPATILSFFICWLLLLSCQSNYWTVQRSENFRSGIQSAIISFPPMIEYRNGESDHGALEVEKKVSRLKRTMLSAAAKTGVNVSFRETENKQSVLYFDQLLYLRKSIIDAAFENYSSLYSGGSMMENELAKSVYLYPPRLPMELGKFSANFGTKYYSLLRLQVYESSFQLQHVIVDTDLSEVVLSERKTIDHRLNEALLSQAVYDSYALLSKELRGR